MGMISRRLLSWAVLAALTAGSAFAAPKLRLTESTIGPISIATGANGPLQSVRAFNAGDGQLNLTVTASVPWLTPVVRPAVGCALGGGTCLPIEIALATAGTPAGVQTGILTVADPNAFDAPQTITVTVMIGGGVPDRADFFVPPNGSADALLFNTNSELGTRVTTQSGGPWLSVGNDGSGRSFFVFPNRMPARHSAGPPEGTHT
ncbi:MAG: hypothetical protein GY953_18935, partial [bacterium]|nr:hypothetical protein [bacterium]